MAIKFELRDMTDAEYKLELAGFDEHALEFGNPPDKDERLGFVATEEGKLVGASSGLAQKINKQYGNYFYLSDLFIEKKYRKQGYGKKLLILLEDKVRNLGIKHMWTWTAAYEAETFYLKHGYKGFVRFESYYLSGHARVGLIKDL